MITPEILNYILGILAIAGTAFGVYNYIRKPQEKGEVNDAVFDTKMSALKDLVINLRDNHLHTLECKLDKHIEENQRDAIKTAEINGRIEAKLDMIIKNK